MTDPVEDLLSRLTPAAPPAELMARLRAAAPSAGSDAESHPMGLTPIAKRPRRPWVIGLQAAAAVIIAGPWIVPLLKSPGPSPADLKSAVNSVPPSPAFPPLESERIFLPVESTRHLLSLQPAGLIQRPDEAPRRLMRAVWVDDVTAVGADTDDALHLRRTHESFVPVTSPIY